MVFRMYTFFHKDNSPGNKSKLRLYRLSPVFQQKLFHL
jgi:hypothetical protein